MHPERARTRGRNTVCSVFAWAPAVILHDILYPSAVGAVPNLGEIAPISVDSRTMWADMMAISSRRVAPGESAEFRSCPKIGLFQKLSGTCATGVPGAEIRPKVCHLLPSWAICGPNLARFGEHLPFRAKLRPMWANFDQDLANVGNILLNWLLAELGPTWPNFGPNWLTSVESGQTLATPGPNRRSGWGRRID